MEKNVMPGYPVGGCRGASTCVPRPGGIVMLKTIVGSLLVALSLFMLLGFAASESGETAAVELVTFVVVVLLPMAGGAALLYSSHKEKRRRLAGTEAARRRSASAEILRLAGERGGKLMMVEVVEALEMDVESAGEALEELVAQGVAEVELTESGATVYAFHEIRHLKEKAEARGVLDA